MDDRGPLQRVIAHRNACHDEALAYGNKVSQPEHYILLTKLYENACKHAIDNFPRWTLRCLREHIEFDAATWSIDGIEGETCRRHIGHAFNFTDIPQFSGVGSCLEFREKINIRYAFETMFPDRETGSFHVLSIARSDRGRPFSEQERQLIQAISPHLMQAWRINCLSFLTEVWAKEVHKEKCKMALVDHQGGIQQATEGFAGMIQREWPQWRGHYMPQVVIEKLIRNRGEVFSGTCVSITATHFEYLIALQARELSPLDSLTPREREVATCFAQGKSHKEIAIELGVSPSTVRNHLQRIYTRLYINSKTQLAHLIYGNR